MQKLIRTLHTPAGQVAVVKILLARRARARGGVPAAGGRERVGGLAEGVAVDRPRGDPAADGEEDDEQRDAPPLVRAGGRVARDVPSTVRCHPSPPTG